MRASPAVRRSGAAFPRVPRRLTAAFGSCYRGRAMVALTNDGEAALVGAIARGDREALARLYDLYAGHLMAVGQRILHERREVEDLLHDVFLEVWRQAADYDVQRGSVRAWLLLRMRSRALDRRKSPGYARVVSIEDRKAPEAARTPAEDPALSPDREAVRRALQQLPFDQRQVLELGYFEGLSSSEIAARIETPIGTVKSRVAAALAKLRLALGDGTPALADTERAAREAGQDREPA